MSFSIETKRLYAQRNLRRFFLKITSWFDKEGVSVVKGVGGWRVDPTISKAISIEGDVDMAQQIQHWLRGERLREM